ncbi:MAG: SDR family oxidoreductase [Cyanobacteria bacterium P01_G01_bin.4]
MTELFSVRGKVALVTGGSSGIGAMIARGLVEAGATVYITSRKHDDLESACSELSRQGDCYAIQSDISSIEGIQSLTEAFLSAERRLDILINNAGATWGAPLDDFPEAGWDKVMDLNVKSIFFLTQKLIPALRTAGEPGRPARVLNVSSNAGYLYSDMSNYSYAASKAAVIHLTRQLAAELASEHINVNCLAPGLFPSRMTRHLDVSVSELGSRIPVGRVGEQKDIVGAVTFLCSEASNYVCGHTLVVDGGMVAQSH